MSDKKNKLFGERTGPVKLSSSIKSDRFEEEREPGTSSYENLKTQSIITEIEDMSVNNPTKYIDTEKSLTLNYGKTSDDRSNSLGIELHESEMTNRSLKHEGVIESNISTSWSPIQKFPDVSNESFIHPRGLVIGNVVIRRGVFVGPFVSIRGDEEEPIYIGEESAILEGTMINALPTRKAGSKINQRLLKVGADEYPLYISSMVTVCQSVNIHGPAYIGKNTYIGMGALVFWAEIGQNCVIEPGSLIINVKIPNDRFVPAGQSVTNQKSVDALPRITDKYRFAKLNQELLVENREILLGYLKRSSR